MYEIIEAAEGLDESGLPQEAYMPTETGDQIVLNGKHHDPIFDAEKD
jgi:hypothetical protein